jgi:uracil-DNA glycosylase
LRTTADGSGSIASSVDKKNSARQASPVSAGEIAARLKTAYPDARYELDWTSPFELLVATVLAAASKDSAVNQVTPALFERWPDARSLAEAPSEVLETLLRPLGLQTQKAARLRELAAVLRDRFDGRVPSTMEAMLLLPGVQRKTANVVLGNAMKVASGIVVDRHVAKVSQRLGLTSDEDPEQIEEQLMQLLPRSEWIQFGSAMVLHGRYVCTTQAPRCGECGLEEKCAKVGVAAKAPSVAAKVPSVANAWPEEFQLPKKSAVLSTTTTTLNAGSLPADWAEVLALELGSPWYRQLLLEIAGEREGATVYPPVDEVFSAFHLTPFEKTRVLLLGQDPYHGAGQAHGLAFSVKPGVKAPPSLVNIYKELEADVGCERPATGCLLPWTQQGVMLLNAVLTVREGEPNSHKAKGWEQLTDAVIRVLNERAEHLVFVLWGSYARKKAALIDRKRHTIVEGAHPSPLSAKLWFGSRPFSQINAALSSHGQAPIDWRIGN